MAKSLIINTPFERPLFHWRREGTELKLENGRRDAGYEIFDTRNNTRRTEPLELVNRIRTRVDEWRAASYPGVTTITRSLLDHWNDQSARQHPFYFCQLEAIETLIWWVEGTAEFKQGIYIQGDGGAWDRLCSKMATGSGKTTVMAMIITWQVLNALTYPKRNKEFSRAIFIVAPGLTVRERLQVLIPNNSSTSYYDEFRLCPNEALRQKLNQAEILIENWHTLMPLRQQERSVVRKGAESDKAYVKRVLGKLVAFKDIVVINDEAHHAYRMSPDDKRSAEVKRRAEEMGLDADEATRWIEGLDRIHGELRINRCFDLSATPFAPTGRSNTEQGLFDWIVSDFGLYDAIEAGLVKTPRVVVRDSAIPNTKDLRPKLYHLYREPGIAEDLNRRGAQPHEALPSIVQQAYTLLGADWRATAEAWKASGHTSPPVMLTVCNRTETAARIERFFNSGDVMWEELRSPAQTLRVDSKVLKNAEAGTSASGESVSAIRMNSLVAVLCDDEDSREIFAGLKKQDEKLAFFIGRCKLGNAEVQGLKKLKNEALLLELCKRAPFSERERSYLLDLNDYEKRLHEILESAAISSERKKELAELPKEELLRAIIDNVGKRGEPGQDLQKVISVAMLSEGWDAKNVTHIMGLRAFTSQLLCEQVIGRGLRRVGYDTETVIGPDGVERNLFRPEYVNVFGVPLTIFDSDDDGGPPPPPPKPSTQIEALRDRNGLEIRWPNVVRVDVIVRPELVIDWKKVVPLKIDPAQTIINADIAPALGGATAWAAVVDIDLAKLPDEFRLQRVIFKAARKAFDEMKGQFKGNPEYLVVQLIQFVEQFLASDCLEIPSLFHQEPLLKRILVTLNMNDVVQHLVQAVSEQNQERIEPVFDEEMPIGTTRAMRTWYTTKPVMATHRSQISHVVADSAWEAHAANVMEGDKQRVASYAKNDHLGFQISYMWKGARRRFIPDYLVRLSNGKTLVLEIKGEDSPQNSAKHSALDAWVKAVNTKGGFGIWCWDVAFEPAKIQDILIRHGGHA